MRIFITGGTGFIGKYVVEELKRGNHELFLLQKDLKDIDGWKKDVIDFKPDAAIHLAWEGIPDYDGFEASYKNLKYGLDLIRVLSEARCRTVLMAGSCWELHPQPFNTFSSAKTALHWLGRKFAQEQGMDFIWTRFFFVYGPGQREGSLIPYLLNCLKENKKPDLKNPNQRNDFIYAGDIARAIALILKNPRSAAYDIGSGKLTSAGEVAKMIFPDYEIDKSKGETNSNPCADILDVKEDTGWVPETSLEEGVKKMLNYRI